MDVSAEQEARERGLRLGHAFGDGVLGTERGPVGIDPDTFEFVGIPPEPTVVDKLAAKVDEDAAQRVREMERRRRIWLEHAEAVERIIRKRFEATQAAPPSLGPQVVPPIVPADVSEDFDDTTELGKHIEALTGLEHLRRLESSEVPESDPPEPPATPDA